MNERLKALIVVAVLAVGAGGGYYAWKAYAQPGLPASFAKGNGRIEAVDIDISTKTAGRLADIMANEGDFVTAGQVLARMDTKQLEARLRQAEASLQQASISVDTAQSLVKQREAERQAAVSTIAQREAQLDAAQRKFVRTQQLIQTNVASQQTLDDDTAAAEGARAAVAVAKASLAAADAAVSSAKAQVVNASAAVSASQAAIDSIKVDIDDATLVAPRDGRIQYRVAQQGEVLASGGRVLSLVDLTDVYMTFFLPAEQAGKVAIGSEVRLVLDAVPHYVIPATASYVADVAQFTPKTVETEEERQKLVFRIKARIPQDLLRRYIKQVKTGLPGMAYVKLDPTAQWPANLSDTLVK